MAVVLSVALAAYLAISRLSLKKKLVVLAAFVLGVFAFMIYGPGAPSAAGALAGRGEVFLRARVAGPPREKRDFTTLMVEPEGARFPARKGTIRLNVSGTGLGIAYGDIIEGEFEINAPKGFRNPGTFDWGQYARKNGEDGAAGASARELRVVGNRANPLLSRLYDARERLMRLSERSLSPRSSAMFKAMILGDQGGIKDSMRDTFSAAGTTHLLSVSGSHVALLSAFVYFLLSRLFFLLPYPAAVRLSARFDIRKIAAVLTIPAAGLYCALAGFEVATVRAFVMICAFLTALLIEREPDPLNILAATGIAALLYDPGALFDISFQLSYGSVFFMALAYRAVGPGKGGEQVWWKKSLRAAGFAAISSAAAMAGTAPLVARQFNAFSWVALPANMIAVPLTGMLMVPAGLLSCLVYAFTDAAALPFAWALDPLFGAFYKLNATLASLPDANLHPPAPHAALIVVFYAALVAFFLRGGKARTASAAVCCIAAGSLFFLPVRETGALKVSYLDVGQGDCALVEFPDGKTMLIDGGGSIRGIDPGRAAVAPYLWNHGIRRVDYVVVSHPHPDHFLGLRYVVENFAVGEAWDGGGGDDSALYKGYLDALAAKGVPRRVVGSAGETVIGGAKVQVLCVPDGQGGKGFMRENEDSLILRIKYGEVSFLFTGDAGVNEQYAVLASDPPLPVRSTVIKLPHHGGKSCFYPAFLDAVKPEYGVVSIGRSYNKRGVCGDAEAHLAGMGARVCNTDRDGAAVFWTDGNTVRVGVYEEVER